MVPESGPGRPTTTETQGSPGPSHSSVAGPGSPLFGPELDASTPNSPPAQSRGKLRLGRGPKTRGKGPPKGERPRWDHFSSLVRLGHRGKVAHLIGGDDQMVTYCGRRGSFQEEMRGASPLCRLCRAFDEKWK